MKIDPLDRYILKILQEDSRTPFTKIAEDISDELRKQGELKENEKIPDTTIHFRVKKLKDNNIIKRFSIDISPKTIGYDLIGLVKINIGGHIIKKISLNRAEKISKELAEDRKIVFVGVDQEGLTIHLLFLARDREEFSKFIERLRGNPDIDTLEQYIFSTIIKGEEIIKPLPI